MENSKKSRLAEMLRKRPKDFAERERKVYEYLLKKENKIQDLKVSEIAEGANVSKATVVRFCKTLGYDGLKDFKVGYEVGKSLVCDSPDVVDSDTPYEEVSQKYFAMLSTAFHASYNSVNQSELMAVAECIASADSVRIIADSDAEDTASHAYSLLKSLIPSLTLYRESELKALSPQGFAIAFAFGPSPNVGAYMKKSSILGHPCVLFTIEGRSSLTAYASHSVAVAKTSGLLAERSAVSKLIADSFIDELYALIVLRRKGEENS